MRIFIFLTLIGMGAIAGQFDKVKITPDMAYVYVYHKGKAVKVHRIQDTKHKLTGEYAKQYRPGQDIQSIKVHQDIETIGEVELLRFMKTKGNAKTGLLVDVRPKKSYQKESIPSAVNIPSKTKNDKVKVEKVLKILGAKRLDDGSLETKNVMQLAVYCNGLWCDKAPRFIKHFLELGYPSEKLLYYRGGFQMWKILGLTTVTN